MGLEHNSLWSGPASKGVSDLIVTFHIHHFNFQLQSILIPNIYAKLPCAHAPDCPFFDAVPVVGFMYLVYFTHMPGESYRRRLRSLLLCLCDVFPELINSLDTFCQLDRSCHPSIGRLV